MRLLHGTYKARETTMLDPILTHSSSHHSMGSNCLWVRENGFNLLQMGRASNDEKGLVECDNLHEIESDFSYKEV